MGATSFITVKQRRNLYILSCPYRVIIKPRTVPDTCVVNQQMATNTVSDDRIPGIPISIGMFHHLFRRKGISFCSCSSATW